MKKKGITLSQLAKHLELSTTTVSFVLNNHRQASQIPPETRKRIHDAAKELNYRPDFLARMFRTQRSYTIGVMIPDLSDEFSARVLNGVESGLFENDYYFFVAGHHHQPELITRYLQLFTERRVEGIIAVDTPILELPDLPVVTVAGGFSTPGADNIILNHPAAARLALSHLIELGHRRIAFLKGPAMRCDTGIRWKSIESAAGELKIEIPDDFVAQLSTYQPSPETGYLATRDLILRNANFTALFTFDDVSALGAVKALSDAGKRVPQDVSVIGFDDSNLAAYQMPPLTTIRQPLFELGKTAAETLLEKIAAPRNFEEDISIERTIFVEPQLIVRSSTAPVIVG
jgi:LacI family transcriptional regulator